MSEKKYNKVLVVGDVHGKINEFKDICENHPEHLIVQVGDLGFSKSWESIDEWGDLDRIKIIPGNHDCRKSYLNSKFFLGDFGLSDLDNTDIEFFFVRGGVSLDRTTRNIHHIRGTGDKNWWSSEELNFTEMKKCLSLWQFWHEQDILISHAAPTKPLKMICGKNKKNDLPRQYGFELDWEENTSLLLNEMIEERKPKLHIFGHLHKSFDKLINGTRYICLEELETLELELVISECRGSSTEISVNKG